MADPRHGLVVPGVVLVLEDVDCGAAASVRKERGTRVGPRTERVLVAHHDLPASRELDVQRRVVLDRGIIVLAEAVTLAGPVTCLEHDADLERTQPSRSYLSRWA